MEQRSARKVVATAAAAGHASNHSLLGDDLAAAARDKTRAAYMQLMRMHNMVPSLLLVLIGAWAGTGRSLAFLSSKTVWAMSLMSGGVAVASVVVNDYFDYAAGVDGVNAPDKPIPSGTIAPDAALLLSSVIYVAVLAVACLMEPSGLRSIVAYSAGATLLYTPFFKRLTAIKNATVASVIALAPLAGALAAGAGEEGMRRLVASSMFAFTGVMFREILMDLNDLEGDAAAGVWTLPVMLGRARALAVALVIATAGAVAAMWHVWHHQLVQPGGLVTWLTGAPTVAAAVAVGAALLATVQLAIEAWRVARSGYDPAVVSRAVDECLKPIGLTLIILAAAAA